GRGAPGEPRGGEAETPQGRASNPPSGGGSGRPPGEALGPARPAAPPPRPYDLGAGRPPRPPPRPGRSGYAARCALPPAGPHAAREYPGNSLRAGCGTPAEQTPPRRRWRVY